MYPFRVSEEVKEMLNISMDLFMLLLSYCIYSTVLVAYFLKRLNSVEKEIREMFKDRDICISNLSDEMIDIRSSCARSEKLIRQEILFSRKRLRSHYRSFDTPSPTLPEYDIDDEMKDAFDKITTPIEQDG